MIVHNAAGIIGTHLYTFVLFCFFKIIKPSFIYIYIYIFISLSIDVQLKVKLCVIFYYN